MSNTLKTAMLLGVLSALLLLIGEALGGAQGLLLGFVFAAGTNFVSYWFSDKIVLRMYGATEAAPDSRLTQIVTRLAARAGLPQPRCYIIPNPSPNAFATGRDPEHAAQHRAGDHRIHLQVHHLAVAEPDGHGLGFELDPPRQSFGNRRLADARLADQHHGIRALAVAEDFQHLLNFLVAAVHRRQAILAREQIQIRREVLEKRGKLEALLQPLVAQLGVPDLRVQPRDDLFGLDAVAAENRDGHTLRFFEDRRENVNAFNGVPSCSRCLMKRELDCEFRRRRDTQFARAERRQPADVFAYRFEDFVRIKVELAHNRCEEIPFHLHEREEKMFRRQHRVSAPLGLFGRTVDNSTCCVGDFRRRDVEIFYLHWRRLRLFS